MTNDKKVFVSIYCKIYTDNFSDQMIDQLAIGDEIHEFLIKDSGQCFDESGHLIPGDCSIWYLGCNEKFGHLQLDDKVWNWSFGESSFDNVEAFVLTLYSRKIISDIQFQNLLDKIDEGRRIDNMYHIRDYLICKRDGMQWFKRSDEPEFRYTMKKIVGDVEKSFQKQGYQFNLTENTDRKNR